MATAGCWAAAGSPTTAEVVVELAALTAGEDDRPTKAAPAAEASTPAGRARVRRALRAAWRAR